MEDKSVIFQSNHSYPSYFESIFLDLFNALMDDKEISVKTALMTHLGVNGDQISLLVQPHLLTPLLKQDCASSFDSNTWREKSDVLSNFLNFAKMLGKEEFTKEFGSFINKGLSDRIYQIRNQAIVIIVEVTDLFGYDWFTTNILGYLFAAKSDRNYLHRQTPLFVFQALAKQVGEASNFGRF